jgi:hypothetical protein
MPFFLQNSLYGFVKFSIAFQNMLTVKFILLSKKIIYYAIAEYFWAVF